MALIKNLHLLSEMNARDIELMEHAALQHKKFSNITFKFVKTGDQVIVRILQGKSEAGNYQPAKRLIEIVHETFDRFFPGKKIVVHPVPYQEPKVNEVTAKWIQERMEETGTRLKDIADDTGLGYTNLSALINGTVPLTQPMKAVLFYYFKSKEVNSN
jgi:hypothetical protein